MLEISGVFFSSRVELCAAMSKFDLPRPFPGGLTVVAWGLDWEYDMNGLSFCYQFMQELHLTCKGSGV